MPCGEISLACQTSFRAGRYRFEIISARAEKGLDQFTVKTGMYYPVWAEGVDCWHVIISASSSQQYGDDCRGCLWTMRIGI